MSDPSLPITGGCLCGAVRYEASAAPVDANYCHCRMCQQALGNLFGVWVQFPDQAFRFTRGAVRIYRSSSFAERGFCATCGSPICATLDDRPAVFVALGSLDRPEAVRPRIHWGIESQIPWLRIDDDLPRHRTDEDPNWPPAAGKETDP